MPVSRPSVEEAKATAHRHLLYDYDLDENGVPDYATEHQFALCDHVRGIGQQSVGLGLYLTSLLLFAGISLALAIISVVPLSSNLAEDRWSGNFLLTFDVKNSSMVPPPQENCTRNYEVRSGISQSTLGSHCTLEGGTSHPIFCPSVCTFNLAACPSRAAHPMGLCYNMTQTTDACDDPCNCCIAELDVERLGDFPKVQAWVLFLQLLAFLAWLALLQHTQAVSASEMDNNVVSVGDYTIMASNLSDGDSRREETEKLAEYFRHYGEVVKVILLPKIGKTIDRGQRLEALEVMYKELKRREESEGELEGEGFLGGARSWVFERLMTLHQDRASKLAAFEDEISRLQGLIREGTEDMPYISGDAIVVFNYEKHCDNCYFDHRRSWFRWGLGYVLPNSARAYIPRYISGAPRFPEDRDEDRKIFVQRAPEPSDLYWENFDVRGFDFVWRKVVSAAVTVAVLGAGAAIQFALEQVRDDERNAQIARQGAPPEVEGAAGSDEDRSVFDSAYNAAKLRGLTVVAGLLVVALNMGITWVVHRMSTYECWHTKTQAQKYLMIKLAAVHLINSAVVPILAAHNRENWYVTGGLMEQAFYIQVTNAVVPDLLHMFNPLEIANKETLNRMYAPLEFDLAERYAGAVKTLGLAMFFGPGLPASYWIALGGLSFTYWVDKLSAIRRTKRPARLNPDVVDTINWVLRGMALSQYLVAFLAFYRDQAEEDTRAPLVLGLVVWLLAAFLPIGWFLRRATFGKRRSALRGTGDKPFTEVFARGLERYRKQARDAALRAPGGSSGEGPSSLGGGGKQQAAVDGPEVLDLYRPSIPAVCTQGWAQKVWAWFEFPDEPLAPITPPFPSQDPSCGGRAAEPPEAPTATASSQPSHGQPPASPPTSPVGHHPGPTAYHSFVPPTPPTPPPQPSSLVAVSDVVLDTTGGLAHTPPDVPGRFSHAYPPPPQGFPSAAQGWGSGSSSYPQVQQGHHMGPPHQGYPGGAPPPQGHPGGAPPPQGYPGGAPPPQGYPGGGYHVQHQQPYQSYAPYSGQQGGRPSV